MESGVSRPQNILKGKPRRDGHDVFRCITEALLCVNRFYRQEVGRLSPLRGAAVSLGRAGSSRSRSKAALLPTLFAENGARVKERVEDAR